MCTGDEAEPQVSTPAACGADEAADRHALQRRGQHVHRRLRVGDLSCALQDHVFGQRRLPPNYMCIATHLSDSGARRWHERWQAPRQRPIGGTGGTSGVIGITLPIGGTLSVTP